MKLFVLNRNYTCLIISTISSKCISLNHFHKVSNKVSNCVPSASPDSKSVSISFRLRHSSLHPSHLDLCYKQRPFLCRQLHLLQRQQPTLQRTSQYLQLTQYYHTRFWRLHLCCHKWGCQFFVQFLLYIDCSA